MIRLEIEITGTGKNIRVKCTLFEIGEVLPNESDCAAELTELIEVRALELLRNPKDMTGKS